MIQLISDHHIYHTCSYMYNHIFNPFKHFTFMFSLFAGALRDLTGTYSSTFYFIGAGNLFAACFLTIDILYIHFKKKTNTTAQVVNLELGADGK